MSKIIKGDKINRFKYCMKPITIESRWRIERNIQGEVDRRKYLFDMLICDRIFNGLRDVK